MDFNGSNVGEQIDVGANGSRVRIARNVALVTMDVDGVEGLALRVFGGVDQVNVGDLTGSALETVDVDLAASGGGGDGLSDTVTTSGTDRRDRVRVTRSDAQVLTSGLAALTRIAGSEPGVDLLRVSTLGGDDDVTVAPGVADLIATAVDLGADES